MTGSRERGGGEDEDTTQVLAFAQRIVQCLIIICRWVAGQVYMQTISSDYQFSFTVLTVILILVIVISISQKLFLSLLMSWALKKYSKMNVVARIYNIMSNLSFCGLFDGWLVFVLVFAVKKLCKKCK